MRKIVTLILISVLILTSTATAFAKSDKAEKRNSKKTYQQQGIDQKGEKQTFKINGSPVITIGRFKLPIRPITKGMDADIEFDKETSILEVKKANTTIVIDFKKEVVTVNDVPVTDTDIFEVKNSKKAVVLIKFIAGLLGFDVDDENDEIIIEDPELSKPMKVSVATVSITGSAITTNTLNKSTLSMTVTADIVPGQAVGGKAELYVGSRHIATDSVIAAEDTKVTFTVPGNNAGNVQLQTAVPEGGEVKVKLFNSNNEYVVSDKGNPTLTVDYLAPTITNITSAIYHVKEKELYLISEGASAIGDKVDVRKITLYDTYLGKSYQLTDTVDTGSTGNVYSSKSLLINIGSADELGLASFGQGDVYAYISYDSLIVDAAGNTSGDITANHTIPVSIVE